MIRNLFIVASLTTVLLSACGRQTPAETATPSLTETQVATATQASTATEAPTWLPTDTSTPETPIPTNLPDCTNSASFVADITIPDNSEVATGTTFTKTWRINNTGTCIWGPGYRLTHYSDEQMGAPDSVPLGVTWPGQSLDISVDLTASESSGTHRGNFVVKNPAGLIMKVGDDSRLWVIIKVTNTAAAGATAIPVSTSTLVLSTSNSSDSNSGFAHATCPFTTDRDKLTETINAVNAYRAQNSLPAYTVNMLLARAAQTHADDMACNKLFGHTGSDGSTPQSRVATSGYIASSVTENVYGSYPPLSGQGVVNWWINDKTDLHHNQNLLSTTFTEIGVGYSFFDNYGYYAIVFAKP